jgi:hypothetical protein
LLISLFVFGPTNRQMGTLFAQLAEGQGGEGVEARLDALGKRNAIVSGISHLLFCVILILMVWKPG